MGEPFAALDEVTRMRLGTELQRWWAERGLAVVFVTHSVFEAAYLSQRVLVMSARPGRIAHEVVIEAPAPREAGFRLTPEYQAICRDLSAALERAA
jgi:NitT/TauT family transport system ATP-binding protein